MPPRTLFALVALLQPATAVAQDKALPRVLLLCDSIRLGYAQLVAKKLDGVAVVVSPKDNCADTPTTLAGLDKWLADAKPDLAHFNCGLHDLKLSKKSKSYQVPLDKYGPNLEAIVARLRQTTPHVLFATTTPVIDTRHAARTADFDRLAADVARYNDTAVSLMKRLGVPVDDLYRIVRDGGSETLLGKDGTHYTPAGYDRLADAVADTIKRHLYALNPPKLKPPASGPDAVTAYRKAEADLDAAVPEPFRSMRVPEFPMPASKADWDIRRPDVRAKVIASLGDLPQRPVKPVAHLVSVEHRPGFRIERIRLDNGFGEKMSAMLLVPDRLDKSAPAVLWLHSSSFDHRQLLTPDTNGGAEPLGEVFVKRGWVVFAPDAAWYGDRTGAGPGGPSETTAAQQTSQHKLHLWFGRTLWGMFVRDDQVALDYLCSRPEVDPSRIGATGMSMGSTRGWWLAAVDDRVQCVAGVACLTRYEQLIRHGQLKQHGVYYFVNGLLKHFDTEAVVGLIAPRPALFLTGELDAGSPADGIKIIEAKAGGVYRAAGAADAFRSVRYPEVGHTYTPAMRAAVLAWFDRWLR